jgi:aminomethyltransferase
MTPFQVLPVDDFILATTGYTGEPGFEIFVPWAKAAGFWEELLSTGGGDGLVPVGLGARDTLRLEMKYSLYGNDIDETTNPIEAGLGWVVKVDKPQGFVGRDALKQIKNEGITRKLVGLQLTDRGIARHGHRVFDAEGRQVGTVTSGTQSPSLETAIALAYIDLPHHKIGTQVFVDIRGRNVAADVVKTPFYRRAVS